MNTRNVTLTTAEALSPLHRHRLIVGLTQADIAMRARVSRAAVGQYEAGDNRPHPHRMADLAAAYRLSPAEFVDLLTGHHPCS
jgi:transcriptional regulator with XRE-family HTH domain